MQYMTSILLAYSVQWFGPAEADHRMIDLKILLDNCRTTEDNS